MLNLQKSVEFFQLLFIQSLIKGPDKDIFVLSGSGNLRFFFKNIRYAEDLHFDIDAISINALKNKINAILKDSNFRETLRSKGIEIIYQEELKQSAFSQVWRLTIDKCGASYTTDLYFYRRGMQRKILFQPIEKEYTEMHGFQPIRLNHYTAIETYNETVANILSHTKNKGRDIFDLNFLLSFGVDPKTLNASLRNKLKFAMMNIMSLGFLEFKKEVLPFLVAPYQEYYNEEAIWENLQFKLLKILENLHSHYRLAS